MRKILALTICTICLSFPATVQANENVTNQLDEILVQLDNLEQVIQFFIDNKENLEWWIEGDFVVDYIDPLNTRLLQIAVHLSNIRNSVELDIAPDVASIQADVAALSSDMAVFVSQIVASINGVTSEIDDLHQWLINIELDRIQYMLTQPQLDDSLNNFLSTFLNQLENIHDYSSVLAQILQSIQEMDYSDQVEAALYNISLALDNLQNITVVIDLQEQLDNLDLNIDLDLGTALNRLETDLSSVLSSLDHLSYVVQNFVYMFSDLKNDQEITNAELSAFLHWYTDTFFPGLRTVLSAHNVWLERQEAREEEEAEHRDKQDEFLTGDGDFPTAYEPPSVIIELEDALEEEPEVPDDKIEAAGDAVSADMGEVEHELEDAMEEVDGAFKGFLEDVKFKWGSFNPVLKFSVTLPTPSNYKFDLEYDFSSSDLLSPCRTASTGIWGILLFVQSYFAISSTLKGITNN